MRSIFDYTDYRKYLKALHRELKEGSGLTLRAFARSAGIKSQNYLTWVIEGKRDLTGALLFKFAGSLGLNYYETQYFEVMVHRQQAKCPEQHSYYDARLKEMKKSKPSAGTEMKSQDFRFPWYFPQVMLFLDGKETAQAQALVRERFKTGPGQAAAVIKSLLEQGFLNEAGGRFRAGTAFRYFFDRKGGKETYRRYLRRHIIQSLQEVDERYARGKFLSHTFTVSGLDRLDFYGAMVRDCVMRINSSAEGETSREVIQLNIQMYPAPTLEGTGARREPPA